MHYLDELRVLAIGIWNFGIRLDARWVDHIFKQNVCKREMNWMVHLCTFRNETSLLCICPKSVWKQTDITWNDLPKHVQKTRKNLPWFSGYGRRLMYNRSWVRIPAPWTGWTWHFFSLICCSNCIACLKRPKINEKSAGVGPF